MDYKYYYSNNNGKDDYGLKCIDEEGYGLKCNKYKIEFPPQHQDTQPGMEYLMYPRPIFANPNYKSAGKLDGKVAIITGGDSGIGRAVAISYVKEGAKVVIVYLNEHQDAKETSDYIKKIGGDCLLLAGDLKNPSFCDYIVDMTMKRYGKIDILVNNAGVQYQQKSLLDITDNQFDFTMRSNIYSMFYLTKRALKHMLPSASIINVSSITAFYGEPELIDYVTSKGAIVGFTRALATNLADKNIRVNAVAPGFIETDMTASLTDDVKAAYMEKIPLKSLGKAEDIAQAVIYLASPMSDYMTGQTLHLNGGLYM